MTYKLIFSKEAANDIDELFQYISVSLFSPIAAKNLMREIDNAISLLKTQPFMCPVCSDEVLKEMNYRRLIVQNYIIIYSVNEKSQAVNILRLFYGKSDYLKYLK